MILMRKKSTFQRIYLCQRNKKHIFTTQNEYKTDT